MIDVRVLGPIEILVHGKPPPAVLRRPKNLTLFVYVACAGTRGRSREHLIGMLWPEKDQELAGHSLTQALSEVRHCVGEDVLDAQVDPVRLAPGAVRLDTEQFDQLVNQGDWTAAAALVRGEFLEGFRSRGSSTFEDWLSTERREWSRRAGDVVLRHAEAELVRGRSREAVELAARARRIAPTSETAVMTAMRALALEGDRAAALEEFEEFRRRLKDELGTQPSGPCTTLADRIRSERGGRAPRAGETEPERRRAPMVGRAAELAQLWEVWNDRRTGAAAAVLIGDTGVGKSRLAEELTARMRLDGAVSAAIRSVESDLQTPWSGVTGLARGGLLAASGLAATPAPALAWFADRIGEWGDRFPAVRHAAPEPSPARAFSDILRAALVEQPVVLFVDDAELLDRESLLALDAALRDLVQYPLFVLVSTTPGAVRPELDAIHARLGRDVRGVGVRLGPLSAADIRLLARWAEPGYDDQQLDRLTKRVASDSAGLPLLVVELLSAVAVGFDLTRSREAWPQPFRTLDQTLPGGLPEGVIGATRVVFWRLSAPAQRVLQAAAVLDGELDAGRLARATALPPPVVADALDELEWGRWLVADGRGYTFVARIVRQVVAQDLVTQGQRRRFLEAVSP